MNIRVETYRYQH